MSPSTRLPALLPEYWSRLPTFHLIQTIGALQSIRSGCIRSLVEHQLRFSRFLEASHYLLERWQLQFRLNGREARGYQSCYWQFPALELQYSKHTHGQA